MLFRLNRSVDRQHIFRLPLLAVIACLCIILIVPAASQGQVFPGEEWELIADPATAGYDAARLAELPAYLETLDTTALMVVVGGKVLFSWGNLDTLTYLASCRKSILAMLYGRFVEDGTIDLSLTLRDLYIDDNGGLLDIEKEATIEHLITARSGVYHPASNSGDNLADAPPRGSQQPGEYFLYNNWDFNSAGFCFELTTGRDIYDMLGFMLARPLGFQDWNRDIHRKSGNMRSSRYLAYHMTLSTRDMARIGLCMLNEGRWESLQIIPREWARRIVSVVTPYNEMNPGSMRGGEFGYGYMWWVFDGPDTPPAYQGGYTARGAYGQYITVLPALDMVIVHKTAPGRNVGTNWGQYKRILNHLIDARTGVTAR
ncbi:serine hydrolase domain-containing protein [Gemmatimonadota bacterium]